jgi:hypothetical protein
MADADHGLTIPGRLCSTRLSRRHGLRPSCTASQAFLDGAAAILGGEGRVIFESVFIRARDQREREVTALEQGARSGWRDTYIIGFDKIHAGERIGADGNLGGFGGTAETNFH